MVPNRASGVPSGRTWSVVLLAVAKCDRIASRLAVLHQQHPAREPAVHRVDLAHASCVPQQSDLLLLAGVPVIF